jgi:hypothetical protein
MSENFIQMENNHELENEMLPEYDFSKMKGGVRGKYVERYRTGTNVVLLDLMLHKHSPQVTQLTKH